MSINLKELKITSINDVLIPEELKSCIKEEEPIIEENEEEEKHELQRKIKELFECDKTRENDDLYSIGLDILKIDGFEYLQELIDKYDEVEDDIDHYLSDACKYGAEKCFAYMKLKFGINDLSLIKDAIEGGNKNIFMTLVNEGAKVTPDLLNDAIKYHHDNIFDFIIDNLEDDNLPIDTYITNCLVFRNIKALFFFINNGANIQCTIEYDYCEYDILSFMIHRYPFELIKYFVETLKVDVNSVTKIKKAYVKYKTPLMFAIRDIELVEYLINHGADVNVSIPQTAGYGNYRWPSKKCPLFMAIKKHEDDVAKLLITKGCNVNVTCWDEQNTMLGGTLITPLMVAILRKNYDMVKFLIDHGADVNLGQCKYDYHVHSRIGKKCYCTALTLSLICYSFQSFNPQISDLLIEHGADINKVYWEEVDTDVYYDFKPDYSPQRSFSPLGVTIRVGETEAALYLIEKGCDINVKIFSCDRMVSYENWDIGFGNDWSYEEYSELSVLAYAIDFDRFELAKCLISRGVPVNSIEFKVSELTIDKEICTKSITKTTPLEIVYSKLKFYDNEFKLSKDKHFIQSIKQCIEIINALRNAGADMFPKLNKKLFLSDGTLCRNETIDIKLDIPQQEDLPLDIDPLFDPISDPIFNDEFFTTIC